MRCLHQVPLSAKVCLENKHLNTPGEARSKGHSAHHARVHQVVCDSCPALCGEQRSCSSPAHHCCSEKHTLQCVVTYEPLPPPHSFQALCSPAIMQDPATLDFIYATDISRRHLLHYVVSGIPENHPQLSRLCASEDVTCRSSNSPQRAKLLSWLLSRGLVGSDFDWNIADSGYGSAWCPIMHVDMSTECPPVLLP